MGKFELFDIIINNQKSIYFGGELITGSVVIRASERFKINKVIILAYIFF
jgi:hypothetical protein